MDLQVFNNTEFGTIRTVKLNGLPYFVGKDICDSLGYTNSRKALADHVEVEDKIILNQKDFEKMALESKGHDSLLLEFESPRGLTFIIADLLNNKNKNFI